ncbi:protein Notchless [Condylostylus longicornis]|uniref:protein Notchless n=1 Tax=Condylostylus longicornis TaxID=2530218 RepID=UPI00244DC759|nr:protein Notchless [Condylostylus longicornis]
MSSKKMKLDESNEKEIVPQTLQARFISEEGIEAGAPFDLPSEINVEQLGLICNALLENEEPIPYKFFTNDDEIVTSLSKTVDLKKIDTENVIDIIYQPQAVFKVRPVTRCTSSMPGHAEAVVSIGFSPNGKHLASGSGDTTVRLWDLNTETPHFTCKGHKQWVLCVVWSPDGLKLASACKAGTVIIWDPETGQQMGKSLTGHKKWINCLSWEPYHKNPECRRLASAGQDGDVRIWDIVTVKCERVISGHTASVTAVRWGGNGLLYTSSKDRTIKMWRAEDGALCRTFTGHGHWVNNLALSTDYVLRTGPYHPVLDRNKSYENCKMDELRKMAFERYQKVCPDGIESLVSCSDDFTLSLWRANQNQSVQRMTGHQNVVNDVKYSPDNKMIASASFDKSVRLWRAHDGGFICVFRGHVQAVYTLAWSADSRLIVSGSKDSTLKVWSVATKKLAQELPGHADEVFGVDWAPDGSRVGSGGKDKVVKLWQY